MTEPTIQRAYRAACPGCGAPVEFRSAQSTHAVCAYCQSTVVRDGDRLERIGKMADVFTDYSRLQLMVSGRWKDRAFTVVGRLQYRYGDTTWSEWQVLFNEGGTGTLSEDNGSFVFTLPSQSTRELSAAEHLRVGARTAVSGKPYTVTFNQPVALVSAQGELDHLPRLGESFAMVELRSEDGEVASIDYGTTPPSLSAGREVRMADLDLKGLREAQVRDDIGRAFNCPNCGAPVQVKLGASKSITCGSCDSIIDLTAGIGGELRHAEQHEPVRPLIPLGSTGVLQGATWQVVGFQHRMGTEPGDDEHFGWGEYLVFNAERGFMFLVDAEDGWSIVKPTTGAPTMPSSGQHATYLGTRYGLQYAYNAETTYVAGEFYWPVSRGQRSFNRDFAAGKNLLSMEQTPGEMTWSAGHRVEGDLIARAFGLADKGAAFKRSDASPLSNSSGLGCGTVIVLLILFIVLLGLLRACSSCDPTRENCTATSYRSSGGSWGGFSTGGGHK
ncbi:MAG: DUF4178 domain-containing protein [Burkholderiaceae bacterium]|nr:DUF4178 domain-containing protein [Burkholderiaceae bacterium]